MTPNSLRLITFCLSGSLFLPGCGVTPRKELPVEKSTGRLASTLPAVDMEPITQLPLRYERIGDTLGVGYVDDVHKIYYALRGVMLLENPFPPDAHAMRSPPIFDPHAAGYTVVQIDPPVDYVISADGLAEPGYYDPRRALFFRWAGVRFDPSRVAPGLVGSKQEPERLWKEWLAIRHAKSTGIIDINVPEHRKALSDELNRTATTRPGK